jgi:hypothetical protein
VARGSRHLGIHKSIQDPKSSWLSFRGCMNHKSLATRTMLNMLGVGASGGPKGEQSGPFPLNFWKYLYVSYDLMKK